MTPSEARAWLELEATVPALGARFRGALTSSGTSGRQLYATSLLFVVGLPAIISLPQARCGSRPPVGPPVVVATTRSAAVACTGGREPCTLLHRMGRALDAERCIEAARLAARFRDGGVRSAPVQDIFAAPEARAAIECPPTAVGSHGVPRPPPAAVIWEEDE